jgi:small subunit ribosomal protein S6e
MTEFKLTINNPKTGKSYKRDVADAHAATLLNKDIGESVPGDALGFTGYEFQITGGSDNAGFPMRQGIRGAARKKIFTYKGVGFSGRDRWKHTQKGLRLKTTVCGQKVGHTVTQVNLKITKEGPKDVFSSAEKEESVDDVKVEEAEADEKKAKATQLTKEKAEAPEEKKE